MVLIESDRLFLWRSFDEVALINIRLSNNGGEILLTPVLGGHVLLEDHHLLKAHFFEFFRVLKYNGSQYVQAKPKVVVLDSQIGIEQSETYLHVELSQ